MTTNSNLPSAVTPALTLPGNDVFQAWLLTQPADPELNRLASEVASAEADLRSVVAAVPVTLTHRTAAEDNGDGVLYASSVAKLAGIPRLAGKLAGRKLEAALRYLSRLHLLATSAAAEAEAEGNPHNLELTSLRQDQFIEDSGRVAREPGAMSSAGLNTKIYHDIEREAAPAVARLLAASNVISIAAVAGHLLDPRPGDSRLDLTLPLGWADAVMAAGARYQGITKKEIDSHGY